MLEGSTGRTSPGWKNKLLCLRSGIKQLDMIPFKASVSNSIWRPFMCVNIITTDQTYLTQVLLKSKSKKSVLRTKWGMCSVVHQRKNLHNQVQYLIHQSFFHKKKRKEEYTSVSQVTTFYLRRSSPINPAWRIDKLSESGETMTTVSPEYWVSSIDMSCVTRTNTSATLSFGVPSLIGGGFMSGEMLSDAYT
jgi:hypothetical protein